MANDVLKIFWDGMVEGFKMGVKTIITDILKERTEELKQSTTIGERA